MCVRSRSMKRRNGEKYDRFEGNAQSEVMVDHVFLLGRQQSHRSSHASFTPHTHRHRPSLTRSLPRERGKACAVVCSASVSGVLWVRERTERTSRNGG